MHNWQKPLLDWGTKPFFNELLRSYPAAEIFLVGGAVRDAMINRPTQDFDFVVRNVTKPQLERFLSRYGRVDLVGRRFGVFKFRPRGWTGGDLDIALPRTERSVRLRGGRRDFSIISKPELPITEDLSRRDFTINAMAFNIATAELVDPFGGRHDVTHKTIKTVGAASLRFQEDLARMLRAIRFGCQLNFKIHPVTWRAIRSRVKNINQLQNKQRVIPYEVIAKELIKMVEADPIQALTLLDGSGALKHIFPELLTMKGCPQPRQFHAEGDVWRHTLMALETLKAPNFKKEFGAAVVSNEVRWALIFHDIGKPQTLTKTDRIRFNGHDVVSTEKFRALAERFRLSSAGLNIEIVEWIIAKHMLLAQGDVTAMRATTIEKYFFNPLFPGQQLLMQMFADINASWQPSRKPNFTSYKALKKRITQLQKTGGKRAALPKPILTGTEIIQGLKLKPGPLIGRLINDVREAQLKKTVTTKQQALAYLKKRL